MLFTVQRMRSARACVRVLALLREQNSCGSSQEHTPCGRNDWGRESGEGRICPVIFVGDGRAGKSYLASCLVGTEAWGLTKRRRAGWASEDCLSLLEDTFVSSDSAESVTEGIDAVAVPVARPAVVSPMGVQTPEFHARMAIPY